MQIKIILTISLLLFSVQQSSSQIYRTQPLSEEIHSIEVLANNQWDSYPIILMNSEEFINIDFDYLSEEGIPRLRYKITYCNANWTKNSYLSEIEYINGFDDNIIENYNTSINTTIPYTHYNIRIPNDDISLKLSGNYVVEVYDEDDNDEKLLLTACFSVLDSKVSIEGAISTITDIDANKEHHQLSFDINYDIDLRDVKNDLKTYVRQNNRLDNERKELIPNYIMPSKLRFLHNKNLIFEAGNEFHRFDMSSYRYSGKNVAHIVYQRPNYHMYIVPNKINKSSTYSYDQDQNGKFILRNSDANDVNIEGDYFYTHFAIHADRPLLYDIYINGALNNYLISDKYKMIYDNDNKEYYISLLLKQGVYNYQYLTNRGDQYSTKDVEGNFYETDNEYTIYIYYTPTNQRHHSLIGFTKIKSREK